MINVEPSKPTTEEGAARLWKLATIMRRVAAEGEKRERFDMSCWVFPSANGTMLRSEDKLQMIIEGRVALESLDCNTTACALGWACTDPGFMAQGLRLRVEGSDDLTPMYKGKRAFSAAMAFFSIDSDTAFYLFAANQYPKRRDPILVAERIESLLKM